MAKIVRVTSPTPRMSSRSLKAMTRRQGTSVHEGGTAGTIVPEKDTILAFEGAEGAGRLAIGGRKGDTYVVTSIRDSGPGTLRDALDTAPTRGRTITFGTEGTIPLASPLQVPSFCTIDGSTAPGNGICTRNYAIELRGVRDVIIRHIRMRLGDTVPQDEQSIFFFQAENVILDHCSISWAIDENCTPWESHNVTVQWCFITEGLQDSVHSKSPPGHSAGLIFQGNLITIHHNYFAHNRFRNPLCRGRADVVNNFVYNWKENGTHYGTSSGPTFDTQLNLDNNYFVKGGSQTGADSAWFLAFGDVTVWDDGNITDFNENGSFDGTAATLTVGAWTAATERFDFGYPRVNTTAAADCITPILDGAGATLPQRDAVDIRVRAEALAAQESNNTPGLMDSQTEVGGWPF